MDSNWVWTTIICTAYVTTYALSVVALFVFLFLFVLDIDMMEPLI